MQLVCSVVGLLVAAIVGVTNGLHLSDLIDATRYSPHYLEPGDESTQLVHLGTKVHFYSSVYDHIYVSVYNHLKF